MSFSNLITDQTHYFQSVLEARAFDNIYRHFDELSAHSSQPDAWSILANLIYWTVLASDRPRKGRLTRCDRVRVDRKRRVRIARADLRPVLHRSQAGMAFLGWLKSFIQYSFIPVVAIAFLMIFEQFIYRYVTTLPPTITQAEYGIYGLQAFAVVATRSSPEFCSSRL